MRKVSLKVEAVVSVYLNDENDAPNVVDIIKRHVDFWPTSYSDSVEIDGFKLSNIEALND